MQKIKIYILIFLTTVLFTMDYELLTLDFTLFAQDTSIKEEEALYVAQRAFRDGFYDLSLSLAGRFLKEYPASNKISEAQLLIGQCYFYQNKLLESLAKLDSLLNDSNAKNIKDAVLYWVAEVYFKSNDFNMAAKYYQSVITEFPRSVYAAGSFYSLGWCMFEDNNFKEAQNYLRIAREKLSDESQKQDAYFKIIECLYSQKNYSALKQELASYFKAYPKDKARLSQLYFYLGEANYYLDNFQGAIEAYLTAISIPVDKKTEALSLLSLGWAYLKINKLKEAQDAFSRIKPQNLEKRNREVLELGQAIAAAQAGNLARAGDIYEKLLEELPDTAVLIQAYIGKADSLYNLGEYARAIDTYQKLLKEEPSISLSAEIKDKIHYNLAQAFLKIKQDDNAISELKAIVSYGQNVDFKISSLCQIADIYQAQNKYEEACAIYRLITADYPDSEYIDYAQYQLGLALTKSSQYEEAIKVFSGFKNNFPSSKFLDEATFGLALAYFEKQDYLLAKNTLEVFVRSFKNSALKPQALYFLGTSFYNLGNFKEARGVFETIVYSYNQDKELVQKAEYQIADCYLQTGDEKEAMLRFKALRDKYPDSVLTPEIMRWLGGYYYRQDDFVLARRYLTTLIHDFVKSNFASEAYYTLGLIGLQESKFAEAIENFKLAIATGKPGPQVDNARFKIAETLQMQGKEEEALKEFAKLENSLSANNSLKVKAILRIAGIYEKGLKFQEAERAYKRIIALGVEEARYAQERIDSLSRK